MPKMKTVKAIKARFRVTATGKLKRLPPWEASYSHKEISKKKTSP